jgi:cobalamin biosynthesis protein CobT
MAGFSKAWLGFLKRETLIKDGSKANEKLIYNLKPINK